MEQAIGKPLNDVIKADADNKAEFIELLSSRGVNPYLSWESQRSELASDPRYLSLSTNAARAAAFNEWKQQNAEPEAGSNEHAKFLTFVHAQYKPGMIYALFKRKFRNAPEYMQCRLPEKDKESLFREYKMISQIENAEERAAYIESKPLFSMLSSP